MSLLNTGLVFLVTQLFVQTTYGFGYDVFKAVPHTVDELNDLILYLRHMATLGHVDIWMLPRNIDEVAVFRVAEAYKPEIENWLLNDNIEYRIVTGEIQRLIANEQISKHAARIITKSHIEKTEDDNLQTYIDHYDMNKYLEKMAETCDICRLISIGRSYEQRRMLVIKIGRWQSDRRAIWIDAGLHAREWIAPVTALNIVNKLVSGYHGNDSDVTWILRNFVIYVLPCANPDGYMYSRQFDRLWRKTRKPTQRAGCKGSDPNRNWNFHWAESGVSFSRCSEIFPGEYPFSEVETRNIATFLWRRRKRFLVYLSLHSYGQQWLYPWGYDYSLPEDWKELDRVGQRAARKIENGSGTSYEVGSSTRLLYPAAGSSDDWAKGVAHIKYSYTVELPDQGDYGFFLPKEEILPTFEELWPALIEMCKAIQENISNGTY